MPERAVDDFLGIRDAPLGDMRPVIFTGVSGSGKSTLMNHLLATHPAFRQSTVCWVKGPPLSWPEGSPKLIAVDEILSFRDLISAWRYVKRGSRLVMALHAAPPMISLLRLAGAHVFRTDVHAAKLGRYLDQKGCRFSDRILKDYIARYGATYTEIDIILERCPDTDFDRAFALFHRRNAVARSPRHDSG